MVEVANTVKMICKGWRIPVDVDNTVYAMVARLKKHDRSYTNERYLAEALIAYSEAMRKALDKKDQEDAEAAARAAEVIDSLMAGGTINNG